MATQTDLQTVPHSRESEEALIGAVLINPGAFSEVQALVSEEDFYIHRHRWIWEAFGELNARRTAMDFLTVSEALDQSGRLGEIGGPAYLTALMAAVPSSMHAESYAQLVAEHAIRRRMLEAANQIARLAYQESLAAETALAESERAVFNVSRRIALHDLRPLGKIVGGLYNQIEGAAQSESLPGIPTGFIDLDHLLGGMQPADFLVVAARPGMGKTSFLLDIARSAAKAGKRVAIFSLEMSGDQLGYRLLAQETGIDSQRLRSGKLNNEEWQRLAQGIETLAALPVLVDDTSALTPIQLRSRCQRLKADHGLDLVVLDYLQLMSGGGRFPSRQEEVSHISRQVKALAKDLNLPVLAAAQLSRAVEQRNDKHPMLSDLRESGSIEQDSDAVIFLYRSEGAQPGLVEANLAKHRNGPTGSIKLIFQPDQTRFQNAVLERQIL